jgi:CHAT domain-containing protein/tetratricopeptide (TPR) repeat protein
VIRATVYSVLLASACAVVVSGFPPHQPRAFEATASDVHGLIARGDYDKAELLARSSVEELRDEQGEESLEVAVATDLLVRALVLNGRGATAGTLALAEQTLRRKETDLGLLHPDLAPSLLNLGDALLETADYGAGIAVMQRAVAILERGTSVEDIGLARGLDHLGMAMVRAGRHDDALRVLERGLRIKQAALDPGAGDIALTLERMGWAYQRKGNYPQARIFLAEALAIRERSVIDHPEYAETLRLLGLQHWFEGNLPEARATAARALAVAERTLRSDHPATARLLRDLADAERDLGDLAKARSLLERALAIAERNFPPSHQDIGRFLNDLAGPTLLLGEYLEARRLYERALRIFEANFGLWHDLVATAAYNLALVDARLGDYPSARRELQRARATWERVFNRHHPFVAVALIANAEVLREEGKAAEGLPFLERALAIRERSLGPGHRLVARTLADLAATLMQVGRIQRAETLTARALEIWGQLNEPDARDLAVILALHADLQMTRGRTVAARPYYERALAIREKVFGRSHPMFAEIQIGLAVALAKLDEGHLALDAAEGAETTAREHLRLMLRYLPERQSLSYAASRPRGLDLVLSLSGQAPEATAIGFDGVIRSRALVLDEMAARHDSRRTPWDDSASLRAQLAAARQRLANLIVRGPGQLPPDRYIALVEQARGESERVERTLAEQSATFRAEMTRAQLGLDQIKASLSADSALVSFVRYERTLFGEPAPNIRSRSSSRTITSYLAFVLRPDRSPVAVALGPARAIDSLVSKWRADIAAGASSIAAHASSAAPSARVSGTALRRLVWDPLADHLRGIGRVFVVPDGTLSLVPLVALPVGQRSHLLEEAPVVHYLSAERDLVPSFDERSTVHRGLLAVGAPAFDDPRLFSAAGNRTIPTSNSPAGLTGSVRAAGSGCGSFQAVKFEPLNGTLQEVRELSALWTAASTADGNMLRVLTGRDAGETVFKQEAHRYGVLHLATHGFFLGDSCSAAPSGTRAVGGLSTASTASSAATRADNPLLLSGLALAGANRRAAAGPEEDDGILTAEEVTSLDLGGVQWAVLSACDTGVGEVKAGEGVFGLRRAFQVAGARTIIMSLWSVDDQAARAWMRALYEGRFQKHLSTADAVHNASLALLRDRRAKGQSTHPFYWAAFVAAGDWR